MGNSAVLLVFAAFAVKYGFAQEDRTKTCPLQYKASSYLGNFTHWAVSTDARLCATVPRTIHRKGGNIADAAVATLLCMGVVLPHFMGIGGGFVATHYSRRERRVMSLISREVAPRAATTDMFIDNATLSLRGGLSIAVPGELRGYAELHERLGGRLPWKALFEDAIRLANEGFPVGHYLPYALCFEAPYMFACTDGPCDPRWNPFWNFKRGRPLKEGEILVQKDLACTLEAIAENGPDYFYEGPLAERMLREITNEGAILTMEDLRSYRPTWEPAASVTLQDGRVLYTAPPPGGGVVYAYIMAIMDAFRNNVSAELQNDALTLHRFVEACKFGFAKRSLLGDPRFEDVRDVLLNLTSWDYANATRWKIDDDRTYHDPAHYGLDTAPAPDDKGTAQLSLWEEDGDALSITSTVNGFFGSLIRSSSGIIFNNQMNDFSTPGEINVWGLSPSPANFIKPGKRPQSSMSPTVVVDPNGDVEMVIGAAGGSKIITAVAQVSMRALWQSGDIRDAIDYARLHEQLAPDDVMVEPQFPKTYIRQLEEKGHKIQTVFGAFNNVMAVHRRGQRLQANADYRSDGGVDGS
ncbi:scoloptoxin SSD14 isoform X2 [Dermacentor silvarum]|uniref:scoloptoxin SSD14 isoform X2 n=1 Tax=Dermacentor silvarum TaxID=543639 RepID=UPI0021011E7E|nr:scoloptoxin SSD14 isoform X2 [Dermacentor silvarum]